MYKINRNLYNNRNKYVKEQKNLCKASSPLFSNKNGIKIAILASSRVTPSSTWAAGENKPGVATTYDPARLKSEISNAKRQADIVVVYVHWGMECYETPLEYQQNLAKMYIDEGADIVIGSILMYYKVWNIIKTES